MVTELREVIKRIFGTLLDARLGFHLLLEKTDELRRFSASRVSGATAESMEAAPFLYGDGPPTHPPDDPSAPLLHRTTLGELKRRNRPDGPHEIFVANMCLVTLYAFWEEEYRDRVATALGCSRNSLQVPVLGDLRRIRHSIVHHRGVALPEIEKCEVLRWFKEGDDIAISIEQFRTMTALIDSWLGALLG